jgi:hypothetical protein
MMPTTTTSIVVARQRRRGSLGNRVDKLPGSEKDGASRQQRG